MKSNKVTAAIGPIASVTMGGMLAYTVHSIPIDFEVAWVLGCAAVLAYIAAVASLACAVSNSIRAGGDWSRTAMVWLRKLGRA